MSTENSRSRFTLQGRQCSNSLDRTDTNRVFVSQKSWSGATASCRSISIHIQKRRLLQWQLDSLTDNVVPEHRRGFFVGSNNTGTAGFPCSWKRGPESILAKGKFGGLTLGLPRARTERPRRSISNDSSVIMMRMQLRHVDKRLNFPVRWHRANFDGVIWCDQNQNCRLEISDQ